MHSRLFRRAAIGALAIASLCGTVRADEPVVVGRVRIAPAALSPAEQDVQALSSVLARRYRPAPGAELPEVRVLAINMTETPGEYAAMEYSYARERGERVIYRASGEEIRREELAADTLAWNFDMEEFLLASKRVMELSEYADDFASGAISIFEPMPPTTIDEDGRRLINVGVMSTDFRQTKGEVATHEILSVHLSSMEMVRHAAGAPPGATASRGSCGAIGSAAGCSATPGVQWYDIAWPAEEPVWTFRALRPEDSDEQEVSLGTGLRVDNVTYRGGLVLRRADVPVLNVRYETGCGGFRDWLDSEHSFTAPGATGTGVAGFAVTNGLPQTICQSFTDVGNHCGVAIYDEGDSLFLVSETTAGWYRYIMGWRFFANGDIEPYFDFGSVQSGCICNIHRHHTFWRFDWAIDGTPDQLATGLTTIEHSTDGGKNWSEVTQETRTERDAVNFRDDFWRLTGQPRPDGSRVAYTVTPSKYDGSAATDPQDFTPGDVWIYPSKEQASGLAQEVYDGGGTADNISQWLGTEAVGPASGRRTAMWYHAHVYNDYLGAGNQPGVDPETCYPVGPVIKRTVFSQAAEPKDRFEVK